jgi:hypothetical protein
MAKSDIRTNLLQDNNLFNQGQVFISLPDGQGSRRVQGLLQGEFTISGGNQFNTPLASSSQEGLSQKLNVGKAAIEAVATNVTGQQVSLGSQIQLKTLAQTANFWTGSEKPKFSIDLLFIALRRGDDVRDQVDSLYRTVFPTLGKGGVFLQAPYNYSVDGAGRARGTFAIKLGEWFRATRQVMTNVSFTFSQEMVPLDGGSGGGGILSIGDGVINQEPTKFAPLFARGSIQFEPYRDITYNEFRGYFLR